MGASQNKLESQICLNFTLLRPIGEDFDTIQKLQLWSALSIYCKGASALLLACSLVRVPLLRLSAFIRSSFYDVC